MSQILYLFTAGLAGNTILAWSALRAKVRNFNKTGDD